MKFMETDHVFSRIYDREAILVQTVLHLNKSNELLFKGTVYAECIRPDEIGTVLPFELCFQNVQMFECANIELSGLDERIRANMMRIADSEYIQEKQLYGFEHYIFVAYSRVYQIVAQNYRSSL
ncbi:hypothetical protein A4G20_08025 [Pasteurellaceae bacterium RH1A]|nr:hypothetical protein A4G20_08025 [Pasteurellaceae bacterium RH1A]